MIEVKGLTKYFKNIKAIEDVSFEVKKGEVVGFLGPNGAGKTTTMRILTCFMPPTRGSARIADLDVLEDSMAVRKLIGYLPESPPLYRDMTIFSYLQFVARLRGMSKGMIRKRIEYVLERCGIKEVKKRLIGNLSKGYRQRVGIAQALIHDPEILILDEPTIGLDPRQIVEIRSLIKELGGEHTIILSTHILPEVTMICSRVIIINEGRIVAVDDQEKLSSNLRKSEKVLIVLARYDERTMEKFKNIVGVISVMQDDSRDKAFLIESELGVNVCEQLAKIAAENDYGLLELIPRKLSLEDVFVKLTTEEEGYM